MSKPVKIGNLLHTFTPKKYVEIGEQVERLARCAEREQAADTPQIKRAKEQTACNQLGRPEYRYLRNAQKKEKLYARRRFWLGEIQKLREQQQATVVTFLDL